jgi:hypothetical protein
MWNLQNLPENLFWGGALILQVLLIFLVCSQTHLRVTPANTTATDIKISEKLSDKLNTSKGTDFDNMFAEAFSYYAYSNTKASNIKISEKLFDKLSTSNGTDFSGMFDATFQNYAYKNTTATDITIPVGLLFTGGGKYLERLLECFWLYIFEDTFNGYGYSVSDDVKANAKITSTLFSGIDTSGCTSSYPTSWMFRDTFADYANKRKVVYEYNDGKASVVRYVDNVWGVKIGLGRDSEQFSNY